MNQVYSESVQYKVIKRVSPLSLRGISILQQHFYSAKQFENGRLNDMVNIRNHLIEDSTNLLLETRGTPVRTTSFTSHLFNMFECRFSKYCWAAKIDISNYRDIKEGKSP